MKAIRRHRWLLACSCLGLLCIVSAVIPQAHAAPLEALAFTATPQISEPKLSPSGKWLAAKVYSRSGTQNYSGLLIFEVTDNGIKPVLRSVDTYRVNNYIWRSDDQLIASTSSGMAEWDLVNKKVRVLGTTSQGYMIDAHWGPNDEILMRGIDCASNYIKNVQQVPRICFVAWNTTTRKTRNAAPSYTGYVDRFFTDRNDVLHVLARTIGGSMEAKYFAPGSLEWRSEDPETLTAPLAEIIGKNVADQSQQDAPEIKRFGELYDQYKSAVTPVRTTNSEQLFGAELSTVNGIRFIALKSQLSDVMGKLQTSFKDYRLSVAGASDDLKRILISVQSAAEPETFLIFEPQRGKLIPTLDTLPKITNASLSIPAVNLTLVNPEAPVLIYEPVAGTTTRGIIIVPTINVSRSGDAQFPNVFNEDLHAFTQAGLRVVSVPLPFPDTNNPDAFQRWRSSATAAIAEVAAALRRQSPDLPVCTYGKERAGFVALAAASNAQNQINCVMAYNPAATSEELFTKDPNIDNRNKTDVVGRIRYLGFLGLDSTNIATPLETASWVQLAPAHILLAVRPRNFNREHIKELSDSLKKAERKVTWYEPEIDTNDQGEWMAATLGKVVEYISTLKP